MLGFSLCAMAHGASRSMLLSCAALGVGGVFWVWSLSSSNTAIQLLLPEHLRGRGMSIFSLATLGFLPIGHVLAGALAHRFGVHAAVTGMAFVLSLFALWSAVVREPAIDALERPRQQPRRTFTAGVWETLTAESHWTDKLPPGS